jgi:hypothetical protein
MSNLAMKNISVFILCDTFILILFLFRNISMCFTNEKKICIIIIHEQFIFTFLFADFLLLIKMSRVYHNPPTSTARRPPAARSSLRPTPPASTTNRPTPPASTINRSMTRGARAPTRGRTMHTQPPRQERTDIDPYHDADRTKQQERTTHVGFVES